MGERDLEKLLENLKARLNEGEYVFVSVPYAEKLTALAPIASIQEREGTTLVLERSQANSAGLIYDFVAAWITLEVHSDLEAVGLTATFSTALAKAGISCNVIAGYYHDHLFVPAEKAADAMAVLKRLGQ